MATPLWPQPHAFQNDTPEPLRRRHFRSQDFKPFFGSPCTGRMPMLFNEHITVGAVKPTANDDFYFCNGDGDDLFYIHEGAGTLISWYGHLEFKAGDYLVVPRGYPAPLQTYRVGAALVLGGKQHFHPTARKIPQRVGQLRMDAPYTHRDFKVPTLNTPVDLGGPKRQVTKKRRAFTAHDHAHNPMDTVGWDGTIYPFVFAMDDFSPKTGKCICHPPPTQPSPRNMP